MGDAYLGKISRESQVERRNVRGGDEFRLGGEGKVGAEMEVVHIVDDLELRGVGEFLAVAGGGGRVGGDGGGLGGSLGGAGAEGVGRDFAVPVLDGGLEAGALTSAKEETGGLDAVLVGLLVVLDLPLGGLGLARDGGVLVVGILEDVSLLCLVGELVVGQTLLGGETAPAEAGDLADLTMVALDVGGELLLAPHLGTEDHERVGRTRDVALLPLTRVRRGRHERSGCGTTGGGDDGSSGSISSRSSRDDGRVACGGCGGGRRGRDDADRVDPGTGGREGKGLPAGDCGGRG